MRHHSTTFRFSFPLYMCFGLVAYLPGHQTAAAQTPDNFQARVEVQQARPHDPASIISVQQNGVQIIPGKSFAADSNSWADKLAIQVRNDSPRPIVAITVMVTYPETGSGRKGDPVIADQVNFGNPPDTSPTDNSQDHPRASLLLTPGQSTTLAIGDSYSRDKPVLQASKLGQQPPADCGLQILSVVFDDGTHFFGGAYQKKDPAHPGKYFVVPSDPYMQ